MKDRNALPDVLLLPGLLCDERLWAAQTEALVGSARTRTSDLTAHESIAAMADAVLSQAPWRFAVAGFSMGGCVALEVVARAPDRVYRLALLSTSARGLLPPVSRQLRDSISGIEADGLDNYLADAFPRYVAPEREHDHELWGTFAAMGKSLGPAVAVRQIRALLEYPGFGGCLGRIACPTVVICGREDRRTPVATHEELVKLIPGAKLRVIERAGHFTPLEEPQAVTSALRDWLREPT
ncbi:MAG: alpha/beta fold hydrolase [Syntrophobacteraceae bacterium]